MPNYIKNGVNNNSNTIYGTQTHDAVNNGDDVIRGLGGNDTIYAKFGNDIVDGGAGNDYMNGGYGDDLFYFGAPSSTNLNSGTDIINGFHRDPGDMDSVVFDGASWSSKRSFAGTTLYFDYDGNGKTDGSVLLAGYYGDPTSVVVTNTTDPVTFAEVKTELQNWDAFAVA